MPDLKRFPHYWMCDACAKDMGGVHPPDGVGTVIHGTCEYCKGKKQVGKLLAPWVDFDWPKDQNATKRARLARD